MAQYSNLLLWHTLSCRRVIRAQMKPKGTIIVSYLTILRTGDTESYYTEPDQGGFQALFGDLLRLGFRL